MLNALAGCLFALVPGQQADPAAELQLALQKLTQADTVRFEVLEQCVETNGEAHASAGMSTGSGSVGFSGYVQAAGAWKRGQPLLLTMHDIVAYKQGDKLVYRDMEGPWKVLESNPRAIDGARPRPSARSGGNSSGQGGADPTGVSAGHEGHSKGSSFTSFSSGSPDPAALSVAGLASMQAPSESLADFASKVESVQQQAKDGTTVFTGNLTPKAAEALAARKEPPAAAASGDPKAVHSGTYSITVRDSAVVEVAFQVQRSSEVDGMTVERSIHRTFAIMQLGEVPHEVPPTVLELLK
jgi:hypothetical protein